MKDIDRMSHTLMASSGTLEGITTMARKFYCNDRIVIEGDPSGTMRAKTPNGTLCTGTRIIHKRGRYRLESDP